MKIAIIYNKDVSGVINTFGMQNKEFYNSKTVNLVASCLEKAGHSVAVLDGNMYIMERLQNFMPRVVDGEQMGMVFNMAYGIQGESRYTHIPSMLEMLGIPYVGSNPAGHALALDKVMTKIIWQHQGLPTPDFWVFHSAEECMKSVRFPVIVKPKMESVSFGLRVVHTLEDLREAVAFIVGEFQQAALVEQFIRGREFCVGLLGNDPPDTFPILEIQLESPDGIQTLDNKKKTPYAKICPASLTPEQATQMREFSTRAFAALSLRDFARVDIRMDEHGGIHLLEINSMASLGAGGSYVAAAKTAGYDFAGLVNKILDVAVQRYFLPQIPAPMPTALPAKVPMPARLRAFLRGRQGSLQGFLKKLVNSTTNSYDSGNLNATAELVSAELTSLGFESTVQAHLNAGNQYYFTNQNTEQPDDIVFVLSIDTATPRAEHHSFRETEHKLFGTGLWENKSGIVITIGALQALRFIKGLRKVKIGVLLVTDSNRNGTYSKSFVQKYTQGVPLVLGMQGASRQGGLVTSRSGSAQYSYHLNTKGNQSSEIVSRVARYFSKTVHAVLDISKKDPQEMIVPSAMTFASNLFEGKAHGEVTFSARFNTMAKFEELDASIKKALQVNGLKKQIEVSVSGGLNRPPLPLLPHDQERVQKWLTIGKSMDIRLTQEHRWSSAPICAAEGAVFRLDGLGGVGGYEDGKEYILTGSLADKALLVSVFVYDSFLVHL
jgi:D-alanine-D-alanine ligase